MKTCTKCGNSKLPSDFYKRTASPDGLTARCRMCLSNDTAAHYVANREHLIAAALSHYAANIDARRAYGRDYYRKTSDVHKKRTRERELRLKFTDPTFSANTRSRVAKRRSKRKQATPAWANDAKMREFYELAELLTVTTGFTYEVDHIVPLQSDIVCGLHCEQNLQVLTLEKNRAKSNVTWPDMP